MIVTKNFFIKENHKLKNIKSQGDVYTGHFRKILQVLDKDKSVLKYVFVIDDYSLRSIINFTKEEGHFQYSSDIEIEEIVCALTEATYLKPC